MKPSKMMLCAGVAALLLSLGTPVTRAQQQRVPSRVVSQVDDTRTVSLKGNVHPLARPEFDRGAVPDSQPVSRMLLMLQRSPQQETALEQLIDAQHSKGSASYHAWLTPEQFGKQFGPSDADVQAVTDWLTKQGFQVAKVAAGRGVIEFNGNVAQVRSAFHTELHKFEVNGETHIANVSDPEIPEALAPVVRGPVALNDFPRHAHSRNKGIYRMDRETGRIQPLFTYGDPANYAMAPADFYKIYNVPSNATGAGVTIAIVGDSNINAQDVIDFRTLFSLPQNFTQENNVLVNGPDPGLNGDEGEADLDVQWAGAVAPQANILLVTSSNTQSNPSQITTGIDLSALYIVDNDPGVLVNGVNVPASILSESFGECEPLLLASGNTFYNSLWQQAASEGITVAVSTGDSGSAGCDSVDAGSPDAAVNGLAVNGVASTAYNTAVGGTDFEASAVPGTAPVYWGSTNGSVNGSPFGSALQYVPEVTWNDSSCAAYFPAACASVDPNGLDLAAAGGGPSNCGYWTGTNGKCRVGYPSSLAPYQNGFNTGSFQSVRTIPDVSFFAGVNSASMVAVIVCQSDLNTDGASCSLSSPYTDFNLVGGTSAAAPAFAGVVALINQKTGQRTGNANYGLYALAAGDTNYTSASGNCNATQTGGPNSACNFNDVTTGNIGVACLLGSTDAFGNTNWCAGVGGTYGVTVINGTSTVAFNAAKGYDMATGLGTINVANLLNNWNNANRSTTTTSVSNLSGGSPSGSNFTATISVSPSASSGSVALIALSSSNPNSILGVVGGQSNNGATSPFLLSNGTVSVQTNLLPPGTAYVEGSYSGDATHAGSVSAPVALSSTVSGANYNTKIQMNFVTFDSNGNPVPTTQAKTVSYGSAYVMNVLVTNNGNGCGYTYPYTQAIIPCPTGTIALTDAGQPLNDFPSGPNFNASNKATVSNQGLIEDAYVQLTGGSHSIQAAYTSGDTNYASGSSNTLSITITPAATSMAVGGTGSGTTVSLTAVVGSSSNSSQGPTGTVQFQSNGSNLGSPVTCVPSGATTSNGSSVGAYCTAQLTTTVAALYPPPADGRRPNLPLWPLLFAAVSLLLFAVGLRWIPQNRRRAYAYAGLLVFALLAVGIAGCGGGGSSSGGTTTLSIKATYAGDTNYSGSSGTTTVTVQ